MYDEDQFRGEVEEGRGAGTYMALGPGGQQLRQIGNFQPRAMFLNFGEAKQATCVDSPVRPGRVSAAPDAKRVDAGEGPGRLPPVQGEHFVSTDPASVGRQLTATAD